MELHLLNFALVIGAALLGGAVARRFGYPAILGELIAGIVFGPAALGVLAMDEALSVLGAVGVLIMMLYVGMHLDIGDLRRASWPALLAAVGGFIVPAGAGYWLMSSLGFSTETSLIVALAMGVTSLATKSRVLVDLHILDTRVAHVLMTGALIADLAALVGFSALLGGAEDAGAASGTGLLLVVARAMLFMAAAYFVGTRLFPIGAAFIKRRGRVDRGTIFLVVLAIGFVFGAAAELAGLHGILGTFFAGLLLGPGLLEPRMFRDVERLVYRASVGFLAPVFFVMAGFQVDLGVLRTDLGLLVAVVVIASVGKILGTVVFYLPSGHGWREGLAVGAGMNGRGAIEIIAAELALERGLIDQSTFSILVLMALFTTATVPFLLTRCVRWLRGRGELVRAARREGTIVIGAGAVARAVADVFAANGWVRLVDTNLDECRRARRLGLHAIHGNALDLAILRQAGAADAQRVVCMTTNSSVNVLIAQRAAAEFGVPRSSVVVTNGDAATLLDGLDREHTLPLADAPIDLEHWNRRVVDGGAALLHMADHGAGDDADPETNGCLPLLIRRRGEVMPVAEVMDLEDGDEVLGLVVARPTRPIRRWAKPAEPPWLASAGGA